MNDANARQRLLVWGINYAPEETGIGPFNADLCAYFCEHGWDVSMVTSFPYYPHWRKRAEDKWRLFDSEKDGGVCVYRCALYVPAEPTALKRILHEATFATSSFLKALFLPRPSAILVVSPPLILGTAARILSRLKRAPYLFHVQDMQPDAAIQMGLLRPGGFTRMLYRLESVAHRGAALVTGITEGMVRLFREKGVPEDRAALFPNWRLAGSEPDAGDDTRETNFRELHGIPGDAFLLAYSGNLGRKQGLSVLLDAAADLQSSSRPVTIVIAGDGGEKPELEERLRRENLPQVKLLPLLPAPEYRALMREADLCVVTQRRGSGALFFPSKLLTILSAGKPVIAVADEESELRRAVVEGGFGVCLSPDSPKEFAAAVEELANDTGRLAAMARRGPLWMKKFERDTVLDDFHRLLKSHALPAGASACCGAAVNPTAGSHPPQKP